MKKKTLITAVAATLTTSVFAAEFSIDTMKISRRVFKNFKSHKLGFLADVLKIDAGAAHRAMSDCVCTYNLYEYMKKYVIENNIDTLVLLEQKSRLSHQSHLKASDCSSKKDKFDESHALYGKVCVFTGTLKKLSRKEAMQIVTDLGGISENNITNKTNFLILGNNDYCTKIKDNKSNKQKKAEELILKGQDLSILPESVFYDIAVDLQQEEFFNVGGSPAGSVRPMKRAVANQC